MVTRRVSRLASWLETHPTVKIMTLSSALLAFVFNLGYEFIRIRPLQEEERQARFWEIVARPAPGNSGKTQALEYLHRQGVPLHGINLSCERNAGEWKARKTAHHQFDVQDCIGGVYLKHAELPGANLRTANLRGVAMDGAKIKGTDLGAANLRGASLAGADLRSASLVGATANAADLTAVNMEATTLDKADLFGSALAGANLKAAKARGTNLGNAGLAGSDVQGADLTGARLGYADLRAANLTNTDLRGADLGKTRLDFANVSGTNFAGAKKLTPEQLETSWAWKDAPPTGLPEGVSVERQCDPGTGDDRRAAYTQALDAGEASFANLKHCGPGQDLKSDTLPEDLRALPKPAKAPVSDKAADHPLLQFFER
jgi:uncharacterized protein YjbI with pentapeptide repeats